MNTPTLSQALARYLIPWPQLDWPLDWSAIFPQAGSLALEIGFGNGAYLLNLAHENPACNHVGIERSWGSIQRLVRGAQKRALQNVGALEGDAAWQLEHLFAPESAHSICINFPDPWHKVRHRGRRLIQPEFVRLLTTRLTVGGQLSVVTDVADYARWIERVLGGQTALRSQFSTAAVQQLPGRFRTKYEGKALEQGQPIHYFVWRKAQATPLESPQAEKVEQMPNVRMIGQAPLEALLPGLTPQCWRQVHQGVELVIKLESAFQGVNPHEGLLCVWVKEGAFTQSLAIQLIVHDGGLLLKPAAIGYPRPTFGVKRALQLIARSLLERNPHLQVASSTVGPLSSEDSHE